MEIDVDSTPTTVNATTPNKLNLTSDTMETVTQKSKRGIEESVSATSMSSTRSDTQQGHPKKTAKTTQETGDWNCSNEMCNEEDDEYMFSCKSCDKVYHYRCTNLPLYEIARYLGPGRRSYECASCVRVPEKLKDYRMKRGQSDTNW